jgi:hypothetical protein
MGYRTFLLPLALLVTTPLLIFAQATSPSAFRRPSAASEARALASINETEFREKLGALAHDSTRGRETPSLELAKAAAWVATRFETAGLTAAGDDGSFFQHFALHHTRSQLVATVAGAGVRHQWTAGRELLLAGSHPAERHDLPVVLVTGVSPDTAHPFGDQPVAGAAILVVVPPDRLSGAVLNPMAAYADAAGAAVFAVAAEIPAARWAQLSARQGSMERWLLRDVVIAERHPTMFQLDYQAAAALLRSLGEDPAALLAAGGHRARLVPGVTLSLAVSDTVLEQAEVANVVGMIEGSDPVLRDEAVLFSAHLDHVGVIEAGGRCNAARDLPADSICNGADDNASGTVGVIELAEAFAQLSPRPARTLIFAAFTAEERGLLGSYFHASHPVVPLARTAAVINMDMIVRSEPDTVYSIGHHYSTLGTLVDGIARAHPELRLTVVNESESYAQSDHYPFAQQGVPALFFNSGRHPDLHTAADNVERANIEQGTRILQLVFRTGLEVASARERPVWNAAAQAKVVVRRPTTN